ncbi:tripartite motif-containing protein 45-like isoform X2 [Haliotis rubra]|uniref:tripartite motif-containing protein 45-like isoform X2 n=1 Tax=Haliotis rubra TaxID=36100 RepID=UPI001EE51C72|nr:tripartite motif-containing protein 45-like isoform X2 [Haliotis rubra]
MAEGGAAKGFKIDVTDFKDTFLECPVCVEHFNQTNQRPRLLNSCLHAFCTACLQTLLTNEGGNQITCPLCRQVQTVRGNVDTLQIDPVRDKLTEYVQMKIEKKTLCTDCPDENEAEARCQECSSYLCAACRSAHKRHRMTKDHTIITLDDPQENLKRGHFCQYHPAHQIEFYCNTDEQLCCVSCCIGDHKDHVVKKLENAADTKRAKVEKKLQLISKASDLTQKALQKGARQKWTITNITEQSEAEINTIYNSLKDAVEYDRKRQLAKFAERSREALATVQTTTRDHQQTMAKIEATQEYLTKLKETADAVEMLQMYPSIIGSMDGITGSAVRQVIDVTNLRFKADATALKKCLSEFTDHAISEVEKHILKVTFDRDSGIRPADIMDYFNRITACSVETVKLEGSNTALVYVKSKGAFKAALKDTVHFINGSFATAKAATVQ